MTGRMTHDGTLIADISVLVAHGCLCKHLPEAVNGSRQNPDDVK